MSVPLIGGRIIAYWNYLDESTSIRPQELARLVPAASKAILWAGAALAAGIFSDLPVYS